MLEKQVDTNAHTILLSRTQDSIPTTKWQRRQKYHGLIVTIVELQLENLGCAGWNTWQGKQSEKVILHRQEGMTKKPSMCVCSKNSGN